jgi:archaetidylinositol phosphate synthase
MSENLGEETKVTLPHSGSAPSVAIPHSVIDHSVQFFTLKLARLLIPIQWITPNRITCMSAILGGGLAGYLIYEQKFLIAACCVILSGVFDGLDGDLARERGMSSAEGALLDSVLDRYVDFFLISALILVDPQHHLWPGLLALLGTTTVPYIRARSEAEGKGTVASVGSRSIRIILIILGLLFRQIDWVLIAIALLSNVAAIHRLLYGLFTPSSL